MSKISIIFIVVWTFIWQCIDFDNFITTYTHPDWLLAIIAIIISTFIYALVGIGLAVLIIENVIKK